MRAGKVVLTEVWEHVIILVKAETTVLPQQLTTTMTSLHSPMIQVEIGQMIVEVYRCLQIDLQCKFDRLITVIG